MKQIRASGFPARYVFIAPPSEQELEQRLRGRGTEKEESIQKRLTQAKVELEYSKVPGIHDRIIVNDVSAPRVSLRGSFEVLTSRRIWRRRTRSLRSSSLRNPERALRSAWLHIFEIDCFYGQGILVNNRCFRVRLCLGDSSRAKLPLMQHNMARLTQPPSLPHRVGCSTAVFRCGSVCRDESQDARLLMNPTSWPLSRTAKNIPRAPFTRGPFTRCFKSRQPGPPRNYCPSRPRRRRRKQPQRELGIAASSKKPGGSCVPRSPIR